MTAAEHRTIVAERPAPGPARTVAEPEAAPAPAPAPAPEAAPSTTRSGLTRRLPGTHLSEYLRSTGPRPATPARTTSRDADAERAALDSFIDGLARAQVTPNQANQS